MFTSLNSTFTRSHSRLIEAGSVIKKIFATPPNVTPVVSGTGNGAEDEHDSENRRADGDEFVIDDDLEKQEPKHLDNREDYDSQAVLTLTSLVKLTDSDVPCSDEIKRSALSLASDKHIGYLRRRGKKHEYPSQVFILDMATPEARRKCWPVRAEVMILNATCTLIAVKYGSVMEVYSIEQKTLVASCELSEHVDYLCWLSETNVGLVSQMNVFLWTLLKGDVTEIVFSRDSQLDDCEIVALKSDNSLRWLAVTGIKLEPSLLTNSVIALTQLYDRERGLTQCLPASAVTFVRYQFSWNPQLSTVMCAAVRERLYVKIIISELQPHDAENKALLTHTEFLRFDEPCDETMVPIDQAMNIKVTNDFPIQVQCSTAAALVYIVSKYGRLYVCDLETACGLYSVQLTCTVVLDAVLNTRTNGLVLVNKLGEVLSVDFRKSRLLQHLRVRKKNRSITGRLQRVLKA